jgi:hypothetical protein
MLRRLAILAVITAAFAAPAHAASPAVTGLESHVFVTGGAEDTHGATLGAFGAGASTLFATGTYASISATGSSGPAGNADVEVHLGLGVDLPGGVEAIPYLAAGYQSWNRRVTLPGALRADATYQAGLLGIGARVDVPLTTSLAAFGSGELLALTSAQKGTSITPEEQLEVGLDQALPGPLHVFAQTYWTHFSNTGSSLNTYQPFNATTQEGVSLGLGYSF